ncbi:MAG: GNAT family N-acetyltransferase [Actinomycetota bacterium]
MTDAVEIVRATADDAAFLRAMSYEAMYWEPDVPRPGLVAGLSEDHLSRYVEGWGRAGDDAVIARDEEIRLGAAWLRLFSADRQGYGFIDESTPELGIAVVGERRRRGLGRKLLDSLLRLAGEAGHATVSLSVSERNVPALTLYETAGFERVTLAGDSWTMLRRL